MSVPVVFARLASRHTLTWMAWTSRCSHMTFGPCSLPKCSSTTGSSRGCWTPQVLRHASTRRLVVAAAAAKKQSGDKPRGGSSSSNQDTMSDADFEAMLADSTFLTGLRSKLKREMSDEAAISSNDSIRRGPFDSDEYDYAALEEAELAAAGSATEDPADELATASAARLAAASDSIARKHKSRSGTSSADTASSSTAASGSGRSRQQTAERAADSAPLSGSNRSGSPSVNKRGGRIPSASAAGGGSISDIPPGLQVPLVVLKKYKARLFEAGSPLVYGGAVDSVVARPPPSSGDNVLVVDHLRQPIAWGVFNPNSMFRVRIMQHRAEWLEDDSCLCNMPALISLRVGQAVALRRLLGLPGPDTNVFRLINNEGDRLSGLSADQMGDVVVVQSCAAWSERYRPEVTAAIQQHTGCKEVVWRPQPGILKEEGIQPDEPAATSSAEESEERGAAEPSQSSQAPSSSSSSSAAGSDTVEVYECGMKVMASPRTGQKTGYYADQRDSRAFIRSVARGKTLLDLCCYSGGFAVSAAVGGALAVTGVDSSAAALSLAASNAALNGVADRATFVREDITPFLKAELDAGNQWDIVVLDPPKLAPNKASLKRAAIKYRQLNELALSVVRRGGLLMTCSCSGAMTQSGELPEVVQQAAVRAGRQITLIREVGAAPDHPLHPSYPEGAYLTNLTYRVQ